MAKTSILSSLETASQIPLDAKIVVALLDDLEYLGDANVKASKYYKNMKVNCLEDNNTYVWREELYTDEPKGLLASGVYTYPTGSITTEPAFDYSGKNFNFFLDGSFDSDFAARLRELVYKEAVASTSVNVNNIEKGLAINVIFSFNVTQNDDVINEIKLDGVVKVNNPDGQTFNLAASTSKALVVKVQRTKDLTQSAQIVEITVNQTVNFYAPQYRGELPSGTLEPTSYTVANLNNIALSKYIQSNDTITATDTFANQYAFFITNSNSTVFKDGNDFTLTIGEWASTTAFIIKKAITMVLANGTTETMYLYRTRQTVTATTTFKLS
jgi:hypothetical protein